jgi:hypothetical protein
MFGIKIKYLSYILQSNSKSNNNKLPYLVVTKNPEKIRI